MFNAIVHNDSIAIITHQLTIDLRAIIEHHYQYTDDQVILEVDLEPKMFFYEPSS